ncbi:hypothetical protein EM595_1949 [Duffyella gerundensis]|uniref:Uncharacterized protein n=1 Tax=Duffyella gerundensis TaxID=1619313 RepID=A0A0U5L6V0_9GAMM|nr:hypothetical protein EM595_1949 [Duffyella gerundensis]
MLMFMDIKRYKRKQYYLNQINHIAQLALRQI